MQEQTICLQVSQVKECVDLDEIEMKLEDSNLQIYSDCNIWKSVEKVEKKKLSEYFINCGIGYTFYLIVSIL